MVVLDASAVLALVRDEPGANRVSEVIGSAVVSAVNLQEIVKAVLAAGVTIGHTRELLDSLRLDVRSHDREAAFASAALVQQTTRYGCGLGDRSCMALALCLGVPALTADREWRRIEIEGLDIRLIR